MCRGPFADLRRFALPGVKDAPLLDCLLLILRVALLGRGHDGGVDDLPVHCQKAAGPQRRVEAGEFQIDQFMPWKSNPEQYRLRAYITVLGSLLITLKISSANAFGLSLLNA